LAMMVTKIGKFIPEDDLPNFLMSLLSAAQTFEKDMEYLIDDTAKAYDYCGEAMVLIEMMNNLGKLGFDLPEISNDKVGTIKEVRFLVSKIKENAINALETHGTEADRIAVGREKATQYVYEFSDNDLIRIQQLINELREIVTRAKSVEYGHRARLLKRLEKLQVELHKCVGDLDRFWGLLGDAGAAVGKFGKDTKPFIDRIRELLEIVNKTQANGSKPLEDKGIQQLPKPDASHAVEDE